MTHPDIPFAFPDQAILVPIELIDTDNRSRQNYGNLQEFFDDFVRSGYLIHPPTVSKRADGKYTLIAGGRRTAAMNLGGLKLIPVITYDELSLSKIVELEGEENFRRMSMDWKEKVLIIARAHELKTAEADESAARWGMLDTGALLGVSSASVSHAYQIRGYLQAGDPEICDAQTMKHAYEILLKRRENQAIALTAGFSGAAKAVTGTGFIGNIDTDSIFDSMFADINTNDVSASQSQPSLAQEGDISLESLMEPADEPQILEAQHFELSKLFFLGDSMEILPQFNAESVDHVVTDIPYGIDLDNMDTIKNLDTMAATHEVEQNVAMMLPFLEQSYRIIKPNGFCVFWYDLDHHEKLQTWAKQVGFQIQRWPLVWNKLHPCRNNAATKNYTKATEFAMVLRKGNAVLNKPQSTNVVPGDGSAERKLYDNPFAKPAVAWRFILEGIAYKGQIICDPFVGEMSSSRACIDLGMTPMGIELDKDRFLKGINGIKRKLMDITNNQATFS